MENISEYYFNILSDTKTPGKILLAMYNTIFDLKGANRSHIIMFNKLVNLYGRNAVFFCILDVATFINFNPKGNNYGLFNSKLQKRYEKKTGIANIESMKSAEKRIKQLEKKITNLEKTELNIPEDLDG